MMIGKGLGGRRPLWMGVGLLCASTLIACSNSQPAPQGRSVAYGRPVEAYGGYRTTVPGTQPYAYAPGAHAPSAPAPAPQRMPNAPVSAAPSYTPPSAPAGATGSFHWHTRFAEAQADARAQGKLILVTSTKPNCGLCDKFKNRIVPQVQADVSEMAVGYVYEILRPEDIRVDRLLRDKLPGATLMPLVGFVTSDLQWVHGFYGQTDANQFRGDISRARTIHPVRQARAPGAAATPYAMLNEYGEYEWSPAAEVAPEDAIGPSETTATLAAPPTTFTPAPTTFAVAPLAPTTVATYGSPSRTTTGLVIPPPPPPPAWPADQPLPTRAPVAPVVASAPETTPFAEPLAVVEPAPESASPVCPPTPSAPEATPAPIAAAPSPAPTWTRPLDAGAVASLRATWTEPAAEPSAPTPAEALPPEGSPEWAESMLSQAKEQIQSGQLDVARITLAQVIARTDPESDLGAEAGRGTVAIYNRRRIDKAKDEDKARLREQARRDLANTRWSSLFD